MAQRPPTARDGSNINPLSKEPSAPPALQVLFGERLRQARLAAGMTQAEMAERSGVNEQYVGRVEQGRKNLTLDTMARLAAVVGRSVSDMLHEPKAPRSEQAE